MDTALATGIGIAVTVLCVAAAVVWVVVARSRAALDDALAYAESIVDTVREPLLVLDADLRVVMASQSFLRIFGATAADTRGRRVYELGDRQWDTPPLRKLLEGMLTQGPAPETYEAEYTFPAVGKRVMLLSARRLKRAGGRAEYVLLAVNDITEYRETGHRMELLQAAVQSAKDAIIITEAALDPPGPRIEYANAAFAQMTGWPVEEMIGKTPRALQGPKTSRELMARLRHDLTHQESFSGETTNYRKDGTEYEVEWRIAPVRGADGKVDKWVAIQRDVSERKKSEIILQEQAEALKDADRRKDEFLATLAHELRNPLAPIRTGLQLIRLADGKPGAVEQARAMMERQTTQLVRLVDDLMDISRITRGKMELRKERVTLAAVVGSAVEASRPLIEQMGHELVVTLPDRELTLDADLTRLSQVFGNLLNNAAKFSDRGGRIRLTAERTGEGVTVTVADGGVGLPADKLESIFGMFAQVDVEAGKLKGGLGIGLSLVKRLVELHGGTVEARSEGVGRGSEFVVRLPVVADARPAEADVPPAVPAPGASLRILVVDDNTDGADSLADMLGIVGHEVRTAYDGREGLAVARVFRPHVVVTDIGMPKMDGLEMARRLRAEPGCRGVMLVALTGWGQDDDVRRSEEAGVDRHLVKPVDPQALVKMLAEWQASRQ